MNAQGSETTVMRSPPVPTHGVHTHASVTKVTLETVLDAIIMQVRVVIV